MTLKIMDPKKSVRESNEALIECLTQENAAGGLRGIICVSITHEMQAKVNWSGDINSLEYLGALDLAKDAIIKDCNR